MVEKLQRQAKASVAKPFCSVPSSSGDKTTVDGGVWKSGMMCVVFASNNYMKDAMGTSHGKMNER
jgi:hypothetical protein